MRNLRLQTITPKTENIALNDLIVATFYQNIKDGKNLEAKTFRAKIIKKNQYTFEFQEHNKQFETFFGLTLGDFADHCGHKLIFWKSAKISRRLCRVASIEPIVTITETNVIVPAAFQNVISRNLVISDLPRLTLVQCPNFLKQQIETKFPEKNILFWLSQRIKRDVSKSEIEDCLNFRDERKFYRRFGVGFQVFTRNDNHFDRRHRSAIIKHHKSLFEKFLNLEYVGEWSNNTNISLDNLFRINPENDEKLRCKHSYCQFSTLNATKWREHEKSCTNETKYYYKQTKMVNKKMLARQFLIEQNLLDPNYHNRYFLTGDIETFGSKDNARVISERTCTVSEQKIVSIAFHMNFGDKTTSCFKRKSFSKKDHDDFYSEICNYFRHAGEIYRKSLPNQIHESITILSNKINEYQQKIKAVGTTDEAILSLKEDIPSVKERGQMESGLKYLNSYLKLKIYGFNSEKFDWPIILPGLLSVLNLEPDKIKAIKRGTGLMTVDLSIDGYDFGLRDGRNFLSGGSLSQFGETFGSKTSKGTFCYEFFETIEQAENCTAWPEYRHFNSSLSYPRNDLKERVQTAFDLYRENVAEVCLKDFLDVMSISVDSTFYNDKTDQLPNLENVDIQPNSLDPVLFIEGYLLYNELYDLGIIGNMMDFLCQYNKDDVEILSDAMSKYVDLFISNLETNPLDFISLPGMAEAIMWSKFDNSKGGAYSLERAEVAQTIREELMGGTVNILNSRHAEINVPLSEQKYSPEVYSVPNGAPITEVISYDFNNLYGHAMRMPMPIGPGILYDKVGDYFTWDPLMDPKKHKFSFESIEWLNFMENKFLSSDGTRHVIQHAMNTGEKEFVENFTDPLTNLKKTRTYIPDGYSFIQGEHHFFEYDGCYFHKCIHNCHISRKSRANKSRDDGPRDEFYKKMGHLHKISSCDWLKLKSRNPSFKNFTSVFFNRKRIEENEIMEKVKSGEFFGLLKLDLRSSPSTIAHFMKIGFPCIFRHLEIENSMLHPQYQEIMAERKRPDCNRVLTQTFHADQILITSDTALFYHRMGVELKNLTRAIEFEKGLPFANFVNDITNQRKKATEMGNKALQDIFKLVLNR